MKAAFRRNLKRLLAPRHIAVVGGRDASAVVRQTRKIGFAGEIWMVNPKRSEMAGLPCYARLEDLPEVPDAVFLGVPREITVEAVEICARLGVGGVVCYASGFSEVADGTELERHVVAAAGDMAVLGPNCYGILNLIDRVALWPDEHGARPAERGAALITQSGNIGITLTLQDRSLPLAYMASVGNQAVVKVHHLIDVLADDPRVGAIGLYIEDLGDVRAFAAVALKCAARRVPIVAVKAGRSETSAGVARSHTSAITGTDALVDAFFARYGILRVDSLADLIETVKLLYFCGPLPGRRIGSLSCSGGDAAMLADLAEAQGLELPALPEHSRTALIEVLGERVAVANPLDYHTYIWGDAERLTGCFAGMLGAGYDAVALVLDYPRPEENDIASWNVTAQAMIDAVRETGGRGIIVSSLPETLPRQARDKILAGGLAAMQGLPECLRALSAAATLDTAWKRIAEAPPPLPLAPAANDGGRAKQTIELRETDAKALLEGYGVAVPRRRIVPAEAAAEAAAEIGFPVALKTAAAIAHKTEVGGVVLNLETAAAVSAAAEGLRRLDSHVLVEEMLPEPLAELIVGAAVDPRLGLHLVVGAGGVLVEVLRDSRVLMLPVTAQEARDALEGLRLAPLLHGFRGRSAADLEALVETICALGRYAAEHHESLLELDVNPLMVYAAPRGTVAADAMLRLRIDEKSEPT